MGEKEEEDNDERESYPGCRWTRRTLSRPCTVEQQQSHTAVNEGRFGWNRASLRNVSWLGSQSKVGCTQESNKYCINSLTVVDLTPKHTCKQSPWSGALMASCRFAIMS